MYIPISKSESRMCYCMFLRACGNETKTRNKSSLNDDEISIHRQPVSSRPVMSISIQTENSLFTSLRSHSSK